MPAKKYHVELSVEERSFLENIIKEDKAARHKKDKARILLKVDEGEFGEAWKDDNVAKAFNCSVRAVERLRKKLVLEGFENILEHGNNGNGYARKIYGEEEARLIALACTEAPEGRTRWTVRLLADKMVELNIMESCSKTAVHDALKKTNLSLI